MVSIYAYSLVWSVFNNVFVYLVVIAECLYLGVLIAYELVVFDLDAVSIHAQAYVSSSNKIVLFIDNIVVVDFVVFGLVIVHSYPVALYNILQDVVMVSMDE